MTNEEVKDEDEDETEEDEDDDEEGETYEVVEGDTLSAIAEKLLGDAERYNEIFQANRDILDDADKIVTGQVLRIPAREAPPEPDT